MSKKNLLIFIVITLLTLVTLDSIESYDDLSISILNNVMDQMVNIESYIEYGEYSVLAVHYPVFGLHNIDSIIRKLVFDYINKYKSSVEAMSFYDTNNKSELHIDYEIYSAPANIVSVKFIILENLGDESKSNTYYENLILDLTYDKQINFLESLEHSFTQILNKYKDKTVTVFFNDESKTTIVQSSARKIDINKPMVALTFDDGPYKRATTPILDILKEHNTVATFFIIGNRIPNHKSIVKRIHAEGNEIGNHSYNHKQLTTLTNGELKEQINRTQKMIKDVVGSEPKVMRPTYGSYNNNLRARVGMPMILWSIDPMDWKTQDPEKISQHILSRVKDGDIILMHDIFPSTAEAVELIIPELLNRGFQFVTVSELYEAKGKALEVGKIYRHLKQN